MVTAVCRQSGLEITGESGEWRVRAIPLEGEQVFDIVEDIQRE